MVQVAPLTVPTGQAMGRALPMMAEATVAGVGCESSGYADRISAARPATCGAAIDVPCSAYANHRFKDRLQKHTIEIQSDTLQHEVRQCHFADR